MKLIVSLLFLFCVFAIARGQDTIQFVGDKTPQIVKVTEIGIDEIKYHRIDNLDGPLYVTSKNDVKYIKYANGHIDSINVTKIIEPITANQEIKIYKPVNPISSDEKIVIFGNKLSYNGKPVGEARLFRIINNVPVQEKKTMLYKEYSKMKVYKKKQYLFGFVGLGVGLALPYVGLISSFITQSEAPFVVGVIGGASVGITGAVLSRINKQKRTKQKIAIANLYNN
jgi:hypothetical protein